MLTLSQLLVLTQPDRRRFKTEYTIEAMKTRKDSDGVGEFLQFAAVVTGGKDPRKSVIRVYSDEVDPAATAKVSCSCPYFRIRCAPALFRMGATDMKVNPDEIPEKFRNLQKPGLCPHLLKFAETLLASNSTEMKRLRQQFQRVSINDRLRHLT
jgi:hypothetical protein